MKRLQNETPHVFLKGIVAGLLSAVVIMTALPTTASVGDNLNGAILNILGYGRETSLPSENSYRGASIAEKLNYLEAAIADLKGSDTQQSAFVFGTVYHMGDYCIQGGKLYQCVVENSSTSWVQSEWMIVTGTSSIKSIQRGTGSGNGTITLGHAVNPNKSFVLLNSGAVYKLYGYSGVVSASASNGAYVSSFSSCSFTVAGATAPATAAMHLFPDFESYNVPYSWQVIECY